MMGEGPDCNRQAMFWIKTSFVKLGLMQASFLPGVMAVFLKTPKIQGGVHMPDRLARVPAEIQTVNGTKPNTILNDESASGWATISISSDVN
jgi:hypothetical protein